MAGNITAYITEYNQDDKSTDIASKYGNGWMRLNRSGNYKDTINVLPEEVKLSELAKSDIKDIKLDILNDYFGRTLITAQGNVARIIIREHPDIDQFNKKAKPKFFYSVDAATGREVKDTANFKPGSGFVFSDNPETKIRASFVEETAGVGKDKVTYYGFNRARYKNVKKQLYPTWECKRNPGVDTMVFVSRKDNPKAYPDIVFYRIDNDQTKVDFVQLDGNTGTISNTYYSLNIESNDAFRIGVDQYIAIYQPEMSMIRARDGELVPLEISATPSGKFIPAPNDSLAELMYNDIISQHNLATRANINEYTPIGGDLPNTGNSGSIRWFHRAGRVIPTNVVVPISGVNYTPSKLGLKTAQEWNELDEANSLYDDTPIWLAELIIPLSDKLGVVETYDDLDGVVRKQELYKKASKEAKLLLRIPCKPVSGPISKDLDNYFGFVPINSQYLEIANGPHLWRGPLKTSAGDITRIPREAKQLKGKTTFQGDRLGFMGVIYRGLIGNTIGARKWLEWIVNLWLTTYWPKINNHYYNGGINEVNCQLRTNDGVRYNAVIEITNPGKQSYTVENFIDLNTVEVVYHKDMAAYRDNVFKQRDSFIGTANLNNVDEVVELLRNKLPITPLENATPNKEYWMKYIIPRLNYKNIYMRVGVMTDGTNMRPSFACQDIPLHGFFHTGLSYLNKIPENNPDNRKANAVYSMFVAQGDWTLRTEYMHDGTVNYMNGTRGNHGYPTGYFRLPVNPNVQSVVSNYNFNSRNASATYLARGDGWGFTGPNDKDNWHRGNLHSLVNFEPAEQARLFKDTAIYTMIPWEKAEVDYQYIRGYLHGSLMDSNKSFLRYGRPDNGTGVNEVEFGGYFPCIASDYFGGEYEHNERLLPPLRDNIRPLNDTTPLVRVKSQSPILPHEWKLYEGNIAEIIDGTSSTLLENPLFDHTNMLAYYQQLFNGDISYRTVDGYEWRRNYLFNTKDHPISTFDFHLDSIDMLSGASGLINQFYLPNYDRTDSIWNERNLPKNPRARSITYTRQRADELGIIRTFGQYMRPDNTNDIGVLGSLPQVRSSPQTWLITVGLDILIEHAKRNRGTPRDLKHLFKQVFDKHGIPEDKWLPDWERGPGYFFTKNEIWLDYFCQASKLLRKDINIIDNNTFEFVNGDKLPIAVDYQEKPDYRYRKGSDRL